MVEKLKIVGITFVALALVAGALIGGSIVLGQDGGTSAVDAQTDDFAAEMTGFEGQAAIAQEVSAGAQGGGKRGGGEGSDWAEAYKDDIKADIAAVLGLTVDELEAAKDAGTSFDDLIADAGLTEDEFRAAVNEIKIGYVNQAVADGVLTQEQADEIIVNIESGEGRGQGRGGKGGGQRGGGDGEGRPDGPPPEDG